MIRVVIIEDIKEIREGLHVLIDGSEGFSCQKTFANGELAISELPALAPDVALMDIHLPGINGIEAVRKLKILCPQTQFIMSTVYE
ncbi:MAG: response regulator transcription factor, partial [Bacteroidetes bacterium]|nr:response regulator transcription factor [Bacteroidota bacterium]